ncbi:hypothetical protein ARMGADRAFT_1093415 [Armillaria gallica]|uniref:Uncharacterized protein n=1 Tax=Armillaria gallica TaxID=47427 RepID=A0A2H3C7T6_ARMGA|nr:hypothetical protein ARMGADRAFT_1093415 [Armillaria gallica]
MYAKWMKHTRISPTIKTLPDCATCLCIYEKRVNKVLLYSYGISYLFGCSSSFMKFIPTSRTRAPSIHIDIKTLAYKLVQDTVYPSQLMDANQALDHLHSTGVQAQNLGLHGWKAYSPVIHLYSTHASQYS